MQGGITDCFTHNACERFFAASNKGNPSSIIDFLGSPSNVATYNWPPVVMNLLYYNR